MLASTRHSAKAVSQAVATLQLFYPLFFPPFPPASATRTNGPSKCFPYLAEMRPRKLGPLQRHRRARSRPFPSPSAIGLHSLLRTCSLSPPPSASAASITDFLSLRCISPSPFRARLDGRVRGRGRHGQVNPTDDRGEARNEGALSTTCVRGRGLEGIGVRFGSIVIMEIGEFFNMNHDMQWLKINVVFIRY